MDLRALQYFVSVYETGSISAAAKQCYIAQPSISASIAQLESELDNALFMRHARGVTPTDSGNQLYPLAKKMLGQAQAIKHLFKHQKEKIPVRLGLTKGLGVVRMSNLLKEFTASIEAMELTLVPPEEDCDARIIAKEEIKPDETFITMWQEDYALALPHNHMLSFKNLIELDDLHDQAFIHRTTCSAWPLFVAELNKQNIQIDVRAKIQTIDYAVGLVSAGLGLALLPLYDEIFNAQDVTFKPIEKLNLTRVIGLAYTKPSEITQILQQLVS